MRKLIIGSSIVLMFMNLGCRDKAPRPTEQPAATQPSMLSRSELDRIIASQPAQAAVINGKVISGVIPHHLLAGPILTRYLSALAAQPPEVIILVGPNHDNEGGRIITGLRDWQTPEGNVLVQEETVNVLLKSGMAVQDEKVLTTEHSIAGLIPLIHHYLPNTKIVPLALHHGVTLTEIDNLVTELQPVVAANTILLASVDFSHYLKRPQAQEKDRFTRQQMQELDYLTLFNLSNDYLDSPASLAMAFRWAERQGVKSFTVLDNTNSGILMGNDNIATTSYFTLVLTR